MKILNNKSIITSAILTSLAISGCSSTHTMKFDDTQQKNKKIVEHDFEKHLKTLNPTIDEIGEERQGFFVNKNNFYLEKKQSTNYPLAFRKNIAYTMEEEDSSSEFAASLFKMTGIQVEFVIDAASSSDSNTGFSDITSLVSGNNSSDSAGVYFTPDGDDSGGKPSSGNTLKSFQFEGSFKELLDYVSIVNDLKWQYDENAEKVFFHETTIETFYVYEQNLGIKSKSKISTTSSGDAGDSSSGNTQSVEFTKEEDAWEDIEKTIDTMLSSKGKVSFNRRQGTVMVQDNDYVLSKIRNYVQDVNDESTRTIDVNISILNVKLNDSNSMGINWSYVNNNLTSSLLGSFDGTLGLGTAVAGKYGGNLLNISSDKGVNALIGMLGSVGSVSIESSTGFQTLNNNPVSFQVTQNQDYISEIKKDIAAQSDRETFTAETEEAKDGLTLTLTPRIIGEEVLIDYSMSLTVFDGFAESPIENLQLTKTSNKNFNQSVIQSNGQTKVIMAFQKESKNTKSQAPFSDTVWMLGGNEEYSAQKEIVVITSTPYFKMN
jgi:type IVB pilus formation R64 PilN family outer membrane protein